VSGLFAMEARRTKKALKSGEGTDVPPDPNEVSGDRYSLHSTPEVKDLEG